MKCKAGPPTVAELDARIARLEASGRRGALWRAAKEQRGRLMDDAWIDAHREAKARLRAEREAAEEAARLAAEAAAEAAVVEFIEAAAALLPLAADVPEESAADVRQLIGFLNDDLPAPPDAQDEDDGEPDNLFTMRFPDLNPDGSKRIAP